jgi:hypothetical protein
VSVQTQLGLHDEGNGLLAHAGQDWASWAGRFPCLLGIGGVGSLRAWLSAAVPAEADEVLHALVTLASPSGSDDASAAAMVAWADARRLCARRLALSPRMIDCRRSQLWIESGRSVAAIAQVAANILVTRTGAAGCGRASAD